MMFSDNEKNGIEETKSTLKQLILSRKLLWNGITRNVVIAGGFFTSYLQNDKFKDIDIFVLNNDVSVYNDLTNGFKEQDAKNTIKKNMMAQTGVSTLDDLDFLADPQEWSRSEIMAYMHNPEIVDVINNNVTKAQYILTKYKTREELLSHFDYKHCKVSYVPVEDKLYINRETFDCIKTKTLKWNNKQLDNPQQIYRKNKFLNTGWVLETPIEMSAKVLTNDQIKDSYEKLKQEVVANMLTAYGSYTISKQDLDDAGITAQTMDELFNPAK